MQLKESERVDVFLHGDDESRREHKAVMAAIAFLTHQGARIMSIVSDYIAAQTAVNQTLDTGINGLVGDVKNLNDQIAAFQAASTGVTPAETAALAALVTTGQALADRVTALDAVTPPVAPPVAPPAP